MLINGEHTDSIHIADRGLQYGDGLFETIAVNRKQPVFLSQHLERLITDCRKLKIPPPDTRILTEEAYQLCQHADAAVLKIIVTRGSGGRGYKQPESIQPTRILSLHPFPDYPSSHRQNGVQVRFCQTRLGLNPALAGIKHLNRLEQVMARAEWQDPAIQEGIMQDVNGYVIEGTMTNIFLVKQDQVFTPALDRSGVAGIIRRLIVMLSSRYDLWVIEKNITKNELLNADEIFVCNSVIGIWPVAQLENQSFPVGMTTKRIQTWLHEFQHETFHTA